jgi:uncharacterized membrane protein
MSAFLQSPGLFVILLLANIPILLLVLRFVFDSWSDLGEALFFWLGPLWFQIVDVLRGGDWNEHQWDSLKLVVFVVVFLLVVASEYVFVVGHFPSVVAWANHLLPLGHGG